MTPTITKIFATLTALAIVAAASATAAASDTPTFDTTIQFDASAPVDMIYTSIKKQSRDECKRQIRTERSMSVRQAYLKQCTSELVASAVKRIEMVELQRYYTQKHTKPVTEQFAQIMR